MLARMIAEMLGLFCLLQSPALPWNCFADIVSPQGSHPKLL
jgi:hypothetical protein